MLFRRWLRRVWVGLWHGPGAARAMRQIHDLDEATEPTLVGITE